MLFNILVQNVYLVIFVFSIAESFILRLILSLQMTDISNIILTLWSMFNSLVSLFLKHVFHIDHRLFSCYYLLLNKLFFIVESNIGEHTLSIFKLVHKLAVVGGSTSTTWLALSLLVHIVALRTHCVISTSGFVSSGA